MTRHRLNDSTRRYNSMDIKNAHNGFTNKKLWPPGRLRANLPLWKINIHERVLLLSPQPVYCSRITVAAKVLSMGGAPVGREGRGPAAGSWKVLPWAGGGGPGVEGPARPENKAVHGDLDGVVVWDMGKW